MSVAKTRRIQPSDRARAAVPGLRALAALVVAVLFLASVAPALAADDEDEGGPQAPAPQQAAARTAAALPANNPEAARKAYLTLLFQEINLRRDKAAAPRYDYMADAGSEAVTDYLRDLLPAMVEARSCFHGSDHPGSRAGWDYLGDVGIETSLVGGEVLACPDVQEGGFWTPPGIADGWWKSPSHFKTLYGDVNVRIVACGALEPIKGGAAYETVACLTLKDEK
jgi:hypothetical protein